MVFSIPIRSIEIYPVHSVVQCLNNWGLFLIISFPKRDHLIRDELSLRLWNLHRKSQCEMLIGGDDFSNDVITLGTCFSMFVYIRACFHFALIGGNLTAQSTGSHRGIGGGIQIPETQLQALLPFPAPPPECSGELARRLW